MKSDFLKLLAWLDQVAADPAVGDFALRVALAIAQNARLHMAAQLNVRLGTKEGIGGFLTVGEPSVSYGALMEQCRASKGGVRKAIKSLEAGGHVAVTPAYSPKSPASYTLVLRPRNRERPEQGLEHGELNRLSDAYDLIANMAASPRHRRRRYRLDGVTAVAPSQCHAGDTISAHDDANEPAKRRRRRRRLMSVPEALEGRMSATRRAAWREARLRERRGSREGSE